MKIRTALARAFVLDPSQLFRLFRKHSLLVHDHRPYFLPGVVCHKRIVPASHVSRTSSSGLGKTKGEERRRERERERETLMVYCGERGWDGDIRETVGIGGIGGMEGIRGIAGIGGIA